MSKNKLVRVYIAHCCACESQFGTMRVILFEGDPDKTKFRICPKCWDQLQTRLFVPVQSAAGGTITLRRGKYHYTAPTRPKENPEKSILEV